VFSYIYLDNLSPSKVAGFCGEQGGMNWLWITFERFFCSMISTLNPRNLLKAVFLVIFLG
jgi:hypothetical protein